MFINFESQKRNELCYFKITVTLQIRSRADVDLLKSIEKRLNSEQPNKANST